MCPTKGDFALELEAWNKYAQNSVTEKPGVSMVILPLILPTLKLAPNCPVPKCSACQFSRAMNHNPGVIKKSTIPEQEAFFMG